MFRLRELREENHLTQARLGREFGLSGSTISLYENEQRQPEYDTLIRFADYFGVTVDYLLGHVSEPFFYLDNRRIMDEINSYTDEEARKRHEFRQRVNDAFDNMTDEGQEVAIKILEIIASTPSYCISKPIERTATITSEEEKTYTRAETEEERWKREAREEAEEYYQLRLEEKRQIETEAKLLDGTGQGSSSFEKNGHTA